MHKRNRPSSKSALLKEQGNRTRLNEVYRSCFKPWMNKLSTVRDGYPPAAVACFSTRERSSGLCLFLADCIGLRLNKCYRGIPGTLAVFAKRPFQRSCCSGFSAMRGSGQRAGVRDCRRNGRGVLGVILPAIGGFNCRTFTLYEVGAVLVRRRETSSRLAVTFG